jgi:hypothetical protein
MANQCVAILMVGKAHGAVDAFGHPTAVFTAHHGRISTAVLKNNDLFLSRQSFFNPLQKQT